MATYPNNVVPIGGRGRDPGQRIIEECRERLGKHLVAWLESIDEAIAEEFFTLADRTNDRLIQTRYLDLRFGVQGKWKDLVDLFRRSLQEDHQSKPDAATSITDFSGLSLVDDESLSQNIVIREFSARLTETCDAEIYGLDRRIAALLDEEDITRIDNPLGPAHVCRALSESCTALAVKADDRILLLRRLEKHLHLALPVIYQDINQRLIDFGVLPDLKRSYRKTPAPTTPNASELPQDKPVVAERPAEAPQPETGTILGALQKLVLSRGGSLADSQSGAGAASGSQGGLTSPMADGAAVSQAFIASLDEFREADKASPVSATVNHIHQIRASEAARNVGHVEAVTIDIVAMLFDFIFNDENIPNGVKALVGRLQIPVLKVAMLDQTFFGNRAHPARRFLDQISGVALRWGGSIDTEDPFYVALARLIEQIHDEFASDVSIFGRALDELLAFVEQREKEEETTTRIAAEVAARRERETAAWELASEKVRKATEEPMPGVMAEFFRKQWVEVMQRIAAREDENGPDWQDAVKMLTDLPKSVLPKKTPVERMALISTLPSLLARINKGLDVVNADKSDRRPFFDALVDLHTTALKGEPPAAKAKPAVPPPTLRPAIPEPRREAPARTSADEGGPGVDSSDAGDMIVTRSISDGVEVEEITLVGAKTLWQADHRQAAAQVAELKRGDWVEFHHEDGSKTRERLTWSSPRRHLLVFSNHRAAKAISIAPDALARKIREGQAVIVSEESLFERAMNGVLETLKKQ